MDTAAIEALGAKPLDGALKQIADLKSAHDIADYAGGGAYDGSNILFGFGSQPDLENSSVVNAQISAGGLGLPDRDYYFESDAKSQEIRKRYLEHVAKMLVLIGETVTDAQADAAAVMRIETALAEKSLTMVEKRDPYQLKHKLTVEQLRASTPDFDWDEYLGKVGAPRSRS